MFFESVVDSVFNDTTRIYMCEGNKTAYWVKKKSSKYMYTGKDVKEGLTFLIKNAYFRVGKAIFRQKVGIPIGSDPAPLLCQFISFLLKSLFIVGGCIRLNAPEESFSVVDHI